MTPLGCFELSPLDLGMNGVGGEGPSESGNRVNGSPNPSHLVAGT
jgi:hypothetical protein